MSDGINDITRNTGLVEEVVPRAKTTPPEILGALECLVEDIFKETIGHGDLVTARGRIPPNAISQLRASILTPEIEAVVKAAVMLHDATAQRISSNVAMGEKARLIRAESDALGELFSALWGLPEDVKARLRGTGQ